MSGTNYQKKSWHNQNSIKGRCKKEEIKAIDKNVKEKTYLVIEKYKEIIQKL